MIEHVFSDFLARSSDDKFEDLTLVKVLSGLPPLGVPGPWLGGGALRRTILGIEPDSDFDFFFRDAAQLAEFGADVERRGFYKVRESEHHIEYRGNIGGSGMPRDIQCIRFAFYQNAGTFNETAGFEEYVTPGTTKYKLINTGTGTISAPRWRGRS